MNLYMDDDTAARRLVALLSNAESGLRFQSLALGILAQLLDLNAQRTE